MINLSEAMARVPGLVVANRNNYAQDLQISSRGFGARAGFGVRGVRLYTDGIPASMPDGQGQVSHFDLAGAQRVEVLRGPFSVLYGNSSGGVIAAVSAPVRTGQFETGLDIGEHGLRQWRVSAAAPLGPGFEARIGASGLEWDGFRPQSSASKTSANARLAWQGERDRVIVLASVLDQPADDPARPDRVQFDADPYQTTPQATQFDTRKTLSQQQAGARWTHRFAATGPLAESAVTAYFGERSVTQWLAIAAGTQGNPRTRRRRDRLRSLLRRCRCPPDLALRRRRPRHRRGHRAPARRPARFPQLHRHGGRAHLRRHRRTAPRREQQRDQS